MKGTTDGRTDEDLLNQGFVRIVQYRDDWLKILGWIVAKQAGDVGPAPAFVVRLVASIEDAL